MKIDIYKSTKNSKKYISVPAGTDVSSTTFTPPLDSDLLKVSPFKKGLDIQESDGRAALDSADIIKQINEKGYATHQGDIVFGVTP